VIVIVYPLNTFGCGLAVAVAHTLAVSEAKPLTPLGKTRFFRILARLEIWVNWRIFLAAHAQYFGAMGKRKRASEMPAENQEISRDLRGHESDVWLPEQVQCD